MEKNAKTDNFLKAIHKYTEQQSSEIKKEVRQLKDEKLSKAKKDGIRDSEKYISDRLELKRAAETGKLAALNQNSQRELFLKRVEMTDRVFKRAEEKLIKYASTAEYRSRLLKSAEEMSDFFGENDCVISVNERDLDCADELKALFKGEAEVKADKAVKLGGLLGFCGALRIIADETLDTKLAKQREWFIENSGLSVL